MASINKHGSHKPKEVRRLYEPLAVLSALIAHNGEKRRLTFSTSAHGISVKQQRRDFVDAITCISSYRKGLNVAAAMEQQPDRLVIRITGTRDIDTDVIPFINSLLENISSILESPAHHIDDYRDQILECLSGRILEFGRQRIFSHYMKILQHIAPICLPQIKVTLARKTKDRSKFRDWFQQTFFKDGAPLLEEHMEGLARECSKARAAGMFSVLQDFLYQGYKHITAFEKFLKQLGKITLRIDMTSQLLDSALSLRQDLANAIVAESIPPSPRLPIPLLPRKLTLEGITGRMFPSYSSEKDIFLRKLLEIAPPGLSTTLVDYSKNVLTEVHPELRIINYFDALSSGGFLDSSDKYISCTKPSCFLCDIFISNHPANYSRISATSNVCLGWRLPDISEGGCGDLARVNYQKFILGRLTTIVRDQLQRTVDSEWHLQAHRTESEPDRVLPMGDDNSWDNSRPSSPLIESEPELVSPARSQSSSTPSYPSYEEASSPNITDFEDEDEKDIIIFKGKGRFLKI